MSAGSTSILSEKDKLFAEECGEELKKIISEEICGICGKTICFTPRMRKADYIYFIVRKGVKIFYCKWSCMRQAERLEIENAAEKSKRRKGDTYAKQEKQ